MSEEFNIFKNLEELKKINLLDQLKSLEPSESTDPNNSQDFENDFDFDFDTTVNKKDIQKNSAKRNVNSKKTDSSEKTPKKKTKSRRTSISSDGSLSPTMPLLENLSQKVDELPVSRRTRRSVGTRSQTEQESFESLYPPASKYKDNNKGKGRGRGRGRGSGRGRQRANARQSISSNNISIDLTEISSNSTVAPSNGVPEQVDNTSGPTTSLSSLIDRFLQAGRRGRSGVMRGRRQCLAEIAARSTQVDYIDLISSPMPRVEGFIDLDTYTEEEPPERTTRSKKKAQVPVASKSKDNCNSIEQTLDTSLDEDNPELNIKVNWKGKPEAFKLRKHQKFCIIFEQLAKRENIGIENVVFNLNDRLILADDTPDSIDYKVFHFIDGRALANSLTSASGAATVNKKRDANKITLKIQSDQWKRPLQIDMAKTDKFRILYIKCAEELNAAVDELKLSFDGELLDFNDTPTDLELEGGEAIDLRIKN